MSWTCSSSRRRRLISDTTGYGTASVEAYVPMLKSKGRRGGVSRAIVDAANPTSSPSCCACATRARRVIMPWSVNAGFLARILTRAAMGWDVRLSARRPWAPAKTKALLEKPE